MAKTPFMVADGQQLKLYSENNTYIGYIYVTSTGQLVMTSSAGGDVIIGDVGAAANLVFEESSNINAQGANTITFGISGDTFNLNVAGVTYKIDLSSGGLFVYPVLSADPANPKSGQVYFNSLTSKLRIYDGSVWSDQGGALGLSWTEITGTTQTMVCGVGYIANNASLVTFTLPSTAAVGQVMRVAGKGAGGWKIAQQAGDQIIFGNVQTTSGVTGYISSTDNRDAVELLCVVADSIWQVISSVGNINVV